MDNSQHVVECKKQWKLALPSEYSRWEVRMLVTAVLFRHTSCHLLWWRNQQKYAKSKFCEKFKVCRQVLKAYQLILSMSTLNKILSVLAVTTLKHMLVRTLCSQSLPGRQCEGPLETILTALVNLTEKTDKPLIFGTCFISSHNCNVISVWLCWIYLFSLSCHWPGTGCELNTHFQHQLPGRANTLIVFNHNVVIVWQPVFISWLPSWCLEPPFQPRNTGWKMTILVAAVGVNFRAT